MAIPLHSIVIPVYRSKDILKNTVARISEVMDGANLDYELIMIDDGSNDGSYEEIKRLAEKYDSIRGFRLSRNFGHQPTLVIGLGKVKGDYVAIIDDDLQDPPEILLEFFNALTDGADVAYGVRKKRKEGFVKKFLYSMFYRILNLLSNIEIPHDAGDFCAMKRHVVDEILRLKDSAPFLRGARSWLGFKQVGIEYERSARFSGTSSYTIRKYFSLAKAGILMFSYIPLHVATVLGIFAASVSIIYAIVIIGYWLVRPFDVPGYLSLVVLITFLGGVQLASIGVIGEYIARLNDNVRGWPIAIVAESTSDNKGDA